MLKCVGCGRTFFEKERLSSSSRGLAIADLVCPYCGENLVAETKLTTTAYIAGLLERTAESDWDEMILPGALLWNKGAYRLSEEVVRSIFVTLKETRRSLNANPLSRYASETRR